MLNVCICDDDAGDVARVRALAERFAGEHPEFSMKLRSFSSAFDLLERMEAEGGFDVYLLDILMSQVKGLELARHIRDRGETAEIAFLTSSPEYALDAFDVAACGYLLKPVEKEKFDQVLLAAAQRLTRPEEAAIVLKTREGLRKVLLRELAAVESFNHDRVCCMTDGSKLVTADTLGALMERLSGDVRFFSPHRAYIINLEHITALNATHVVLSTGQRVPVSRASAAALKRAYMEFLF